MNKLVLEQSDARKLPFVAPDMVTVDRDGFKFRDVFIRLPSGAIADDLKEPSIWKKVQSGGKSLRKFDRVMLVSYDESWIAEAIVAHADADQAVLGKPRITTFPDRVEKLFGDGKYQVVWTGGGYAVMRLSDGAQMTDSMANAPLAERALAGLYPRRA